jgi:hypothetical protein
MSAPLMLCRLPAEHGSAPPPHARLESAIAGAKPAEPGLGPDRTIEVSHVPRNAKGRVRCAAPVNLSMLTTTADLLLHRRGS